MMGNNSKKMATNTKTADGDSETMDNPTPEYSIGDRVKIPHRKTEGEVIERWYSEFNGSWMYRIYRAGGDRSIGIYQEKMIKQ